MCVLILQYLIITSCLFSSLDSMGVNTSLSLPVQTYSVKWAQWVSILHYLITISGFQCASFTHISSSAYRADSKQKLRRALRAEIPKASTFEMPNAASWDAEGNEVSRRWILGIGGHMTLTWWNLVHMVVLHWHPVRKRLLIEEPYHCIISIKPMP